MLYYLKTAIYKKGTMPQMYIEIRKREIFYLLKLFSRGRRPKLKQKYTRDS